MVVRRLLLLLTAICLFCTNHHGHVLYVNGQESQAFDPYQLNGGLVAAVAGRDYVIIATDTRMTGATGYDILHRRHVTSRLWTAGTAGIGGTGTSRANNNKNNNNNNDDDDVVQAPLEILGSDGSLLWPDEDEDDDLVQSRAGRTMTTTTIVTTTTKGSSSGGSSNNIPRWMIASAGCSADCEALKRTMRAEMRVWQAHSHSNSNNNNVDNNDNVASMANLLSQVLYGRRGFPFYSFCVLAGLSSSSSSSSSSTGGNSNNNNNNSRGCVYAYDAIGSFEQVAVATAGTGRSLLQPILDGAFFSTASSSSSSYSSSSKIKRVVNGADATDQAMSSNTVDNDKKNGILLSDHNNNDAVVPREHGMDSMLQHQQHDQQVAEQADDNDDEQQEQDNNDDDNNDGLLVVDCSAEEACRILLQAYRAVSEREIGVGDYVVLYCLKQQQQQRRQQHDNDDHENDDNNNHDDVQQELQCQIQVAPLKMH